jgi:DNA polymerase I-like protein with 3'-5' exonuclease and polymerase domains
MSDWCPPTELPDLRNASIIAVDTETRDGGLQADRGSAWPWGDGHICGASVAWRVEGAIRSIYVPIRHPDSQTFDREQVTRWLRDLIASEVRIITKNGLYDWGWLHADLGIAMPPAERLEEIDALATMVDENRRKYSLDALCAWRGFPGKDETTLLEGCAALGLIPKKNRKAFNPKAHIWQLPARFAGPYAEIDAGQTLELVENLNPVLDQESTRDAYRLEIDLLPMVHAMRRRGIRVDLIAAERAREIILRKRDAALTQIGELVGTTVRMREIRGRKWLPATFNRLSIAYPRTEKNNPSFKGGNTGWMRQSKHPLPPLIATAMRYDHYAEYFLRTQIIEHAINGRIYAEINPHRGDAGGTRTLRFSYAHPPLQQMPKHDTELAPLIRTAFLPEDGELWAECDVSQQEFRKLVHYGARHKLPRAAEMVERYRTDPATDFHVLVADWTSIDRQSAKNSNFARIYGAGIGKFAEMIRKSEAEACEIWEKYERELPFVSQLSALCKRAAQRDGYITLYNGARRHFNLWAPGGKWEKGAGPCERDEALERTRDPKHPWYRRQLWRADTRNALNSLIQGSAAVHTKLWMRDVWRESGGHIVPLIQMHDSLALSVSSPADAEFVAHLGCAAITLEVPIRVDVKYGKSWGDAKHTWAEFNAETGSHVALVEEMPDAPAPTVQADSAPADDIVIAVLNEVSEQPRAQQAEHHREQQSPPWEGKSIFTPSPPPPLPSSPHVAHGNGNGGDGFDGFTIAREGVSPGKILCPFHEEKTPSCHIYADGHYHCFGCSAHGWIDEDMDLPDDVLARAAKTTDDSHTLERALELWDEGKPIAGTLAERYLADTRKLKELPAIRDIDAVLRFHPRCPFGSNGARHPCLLALFRDVESDAPAGIHRIGLTADANKIKRLTLGHWPSPRAIKLWPRTHKLTIGEGIETVLGAIRCGAITPPAWAMGPKTDIANFPVLLGVKALTVLVDRGDPAALDGAEMCVARHVAAGVSSRWLRTVRVKDFNDVVLT